MINLILFGPPGSGKGTQAKMLAEKFNLNHISTGDLFRYEMGNNTDLGMKAKAFMEKGELVPDEITVGMLKNKFLKMDPLNGFILDGFPRNVDQAKSLDDMLSELKIDLSQLIALDVPEEEIVQRILLRGETSGRADDLDSDIIKNRYKVYSDQTEPVFKYYKIQGKSTLIDGIGSIDSIFHRLCNEIKTL